MVLDRIIHCRRCPNSVESARHILTTANSSLRNHRGRAPDGLTLNGEEWHKRRPVLQVPPFAAQMGRVQ